MIAYDKAKTAVHYASEFPSLDKQYIGLSVNAFGESEPREMMIDGEQTEVNYVTRFVEVRSCDIVTLPARGGRFVALVESVAGARGTNKEVRTMIVKELQKAQKALKEAETIEDPDQRLKKTSEARKVVDELLAKLAKEGARKKSKEGKGKDGEEEAEEESETGVSAESEEEAEGETEPEDGDGDADGDDGDTGGDGDSHTVVTHKVVKKTGKAAMSAESKRIHRIAVKSLVKESGIDPELFDMDELIAMPFGQVEQKIREAKRMSSVLSKRILESIGQDVPALHGSKFHESDGNGGGKKGDENDAAFADCTL